MPSSGYVGKTLLTHIWAQRHLVCSYLGLNHDIGLGPESNCCVSAAEHGSMRRFMPQETLDKLKHSLLSKPVFH